MFLRRIQVPDFRVLKDVDITFEPEFSPTIFPLGSLNGGGKSTLLQLIFILLTCSSDPKKHIFLQNMLEGFELNNNENKKTLAKIEVLYNQKNISLHFFLMEHSFGYDFLKEIIDSTSLKDLIETQNKNKVNLDILEALNILSKLKQKSSIYLYENFSVNTKYMLICRFDNISPDEIDNLFSSLSKKVFLAAPFTQVFHFLSKQNKKLLFKETYSKMDYYLNLEREKQSLSNLLTYDILSVKSLVEIFKEARDNDFRQAITTGEYGNSYKNVLNEFNLFLVNKIVNIDLDLDGINFTMNQNGETQQLYPEDLSHGELKRLSIYAWIKYKKIEDAIVLMDEIENAFHPDWQYQIISDLAEWGASNQYILATHSYELCQALTPAHVKELEPKLLSDKEVEN